VAPEIPPCSECQKWLYRDTKTWIREERRGFGPDGEPGPVPRPPGSALPCATCAKSGPKDGRPRPDKELSTKNWQALLYYMEIKAGAPMPDDAIVKRNCALIRWVEDSLERQATIGSNALLTAFLTRPVKR